MREDFLKIPRHNLLFKKREKMKIRNTGGGRQQSVLTQTLCTEQGSALRLGKQAAREIIIQQACY